MNLALIALTCTKTYEMIKCYEAQYSYPIDVAVFL